MNTNHLDMHIFGGALYVDTDIWNKHFNNYSTVFLTFDTGATVTTISTDILFRLGYNVAGGTIRRITTASGVEYVREVVVDRIRLGQCELEDITVYSLTFPDESFSIGVLGLNVLSMFDLNLLFSKKLIEMSKIKNT